MKTDNIVCVAWGPALLCSTILALITFAIEWRDIEQKFQQSASSVLAGQKLNWAKAETHNLGRQVLITGAAPDANSIAVANASIAQIDGVLRVFHNGEPFAKQPSAPPNLSVSSTAGIVTLTGNLSNQDEVDLALATAHRTFVQQVTIDQLTVSDAIRPLSDFSFIAALDTAIAELEPNQTLTVELKQGVLFLSGSVPSQTVATALDKRIRSLFVGEVDNRVTVVIPMLQLNDCEGLMSNALTQDSINFETGSAVITESSLRLLDEIVVIAQRCNNINFEVAGHTDNTGNSLSNLKLSQQRAQSVVDYLIRQNLPIEQFLISGHGSQYPIADNQTPEGRIKNRRIEFKLSN